MQLSVQTYHKYCSCSLSTLIDSREWFDERMKNVSLYEANVAQDINLIGGTGFT
jgi:hypothetical protein